MAALGAPHWEAGNPIKWSETQHLFILQVQSRDEMDDLIFASEDFQFSSVAQSCPTLCDLMDCWTPGFPVHHQLPELAQTHVPHVGDAIQPSHPLPSLFVLPSNFPRIRIFSKQSVLCIRWPKYWSFTSVLPMNIQDWFPLELTTLISLQSKGLSRVFSSTTVKKHEFFGNQPSLWSNSHNQIWLLEKP